MEGSKVVARDGFLRAERCLIGLTFVAEPATKTLSRSKGVKGDFGDGRRVPARLLWGRLCTDTTGKGVKIQDKRAEIAEKRVRLPRKVGLAVWACIDSPDSPAVMGGLGPLRGLVAWDCRCGAGGDCSMMEYGWGLAQAGFVMVVQAEWEGWGPVWECFGEREGWGLPLGAVASALLSRPNHERYLSVHQ